MCAFAAHPSRRCWWLTRWGWRFFDFRAQIAEASGTGGLIAVVMGTITGVFGGVLRDVLCAEIPMILRKGNLYATAAIVGTSAYVVLQDAGVIKLWAAVAGILVIVALRLAAIIWQLSLLVFTLEDRR